MTTEKCPTQERTGADVISLLPRHPDTVAVIEPRANVSSDRCDGSWSGFANQYLPCVFIYHISIEITDHKFLWQKGRSQWVMRVMTPYGVRTAAVSSLSESPTLMHSIA
jgi:hypothetical protein